MRPITALGLPSSLLLLVAAHVAAEQRRPTAIRKMPLDSSQKLFREHLAFQDDLPTNDYEPHPFLSPREAIIADRLQLTVEEDLLLAANSSCPRPHRPAFNTHEGDAQSAPESGWLLLRRAKDTLHMLQGRQNCPGGMQSCENIGVPNKCCSTNEVCVEVEDANVGNVACCPQGADCNAPVGGCPDGSPECPASLGGGCCIPGFVCQGVGCVPSRPPTETITSTSTTQRVSTVTTTSTTIAEGGEPSTVVVTVIVTASAPEPEPSTITTTSTTTQSPTTRYSGIVPPWRPTSDESPTTTESEQESSTTELPEDYCPTGFYQCLARQGGGCCRTGRDCETFDCPSTPSTEIISDGATILVPVTDVPDAQATESCANGWFLCGEDAGPVAGCCPTGYECGVASCTTELASSTEEIRKLRPEDSGVARARTPGARGIMLAFGGAALALVFF